MPGVFPTRPDQAELDRLRAERRAQIEAERQQQQRLVELIHAQQRQVFKVMPPPLVTASNNSNDRLAAATTFFLNVALVTFICNFIFTPFSLVSK